MHWTLSADIFFVGLKDVLNVELFQTPENIGPHFVAFSWLIVDEVKVKCSLPPLRHDPSLCPTISREAAFSACKKCWKSPFHIKI